MKMELNKILNALKSNKKINEVTIFEEMAGVLNRKRATNAIFIKKTHGNPGLVEFNTPNSPINMVREIADLLIIVNNRSHKKIRISFLQAKYHRKKISPFLKFSVDYFQWDLLKNKYPVKSISTIKFPQNILQFSSYDSLTSYGVYYVDTKGNIDMLYTMPKFFQRTGKSIVTKDTEDVTVYLNCKKANRVNCFKPGNDEILSTCDIDLFEYFITNDQIGAPVKTNDVTNFLIGMLNNAIDSKGESIAITEMLDALSSIDENKYNDESFLEGYKGNLNMLVINTNGLEKNESLNLA